MLRTVRKAEMEEKKLEELLTHVSADLQRWLKKSGDIFYSGRSTLKEGDFYLMGLNPGGDPAATAVIEESLKLWKARQSNWSEYWDERWLKAKGWHRTRCEFVISARSSYGKMSALYFQRISCLSEQVKGGISLARVQRNTGRFLQTAGMCISGFFLS